ncbi:MAG: T9SS type A sorting domain-containing protein, partial [Melioribacteraceae bacterium]|nr:T9SS type A sorting domain-containing protein [Melioribacteraceae bacterium]
GKPTISTVNTQGTPKYSYFDADTTIINQTYPKINYSFIRYHIGAVDDIADSSLQKLTIADIEAPKNGVVPNNITITEELVETEGGLAPEITGGYVTGETDNSNLPIERVIDFTKISEDEEKEIYNATHKSTDQFGNDTTYTPQKVTVTKTPKATIKLAGLDDEVLINFEYGMSTDPIILGNLGYNAIPTVVVSDTNSAFTLTFNDGEREIISEQFPEVNYKFERVFIGALVSGDNVDTAKQKITIADLEKPVVPTLEDITISKDDSLHPSVTGYPGITDNHGVKDTLFTYTLVTSSKTKEVYNAFVEAEDFFGNQAEDSLGNTKIKYQIVTRDLTTGIEDETELPVEFSLSQNYPNPFNPTTTIEYSIASKTTSEATHTKIVVLDILGREVAILLDEVQSPGNYSIKFDASSAGGGLTSGMYFYRMQSESFVETKKLLLLK